MAVEPVARTGRSTIRARRDRRRCYQPEGNEVQPRSLALRARHALPLPKGAYVNTDGRPSRPPPQNALRPGSLAIHLWTHPGRDCEQQRRCHLPSAAWVQAGSPPQGLSIPPRKRGRMRIRPAYKAAFKSMHTFVCRCEHPHPISHSYQIRPCDARESRDSRRKNRSPCARRGEACLAPTHGAGTASARDAKNR